jgi:hypothetical protein
VCNVCAGTEEIRAYSAVGSVTGTVRSSGGGEGVSGGTMSGEACLGSTGFGFGFGRARGLGLGLGFSARRRALESIDGEGVCSWV